jgi:hypothetical protein
MDRISALRNVEDALAAFEEGDLDLEGLEREVRGVLRTYATDFEGELRAYRATGDETVSGTVVLATGQRQARERVRSVLDVRSDGVDFAVEPVDETESG